MQDQRQAVRTVLEAGLNAGRNPRSVALELVGRIENGKRTGGIVGLTSGQAQYVLNARRQLEDLDAGYFDRALRDKRFDRIVRKAIADGKPIAKADVDKIAGRYADRLLNYRGEVIARTEMIAALHAGQYEGMRQLIETGKVRADQVTKVWSATGDGRTRDTHLAMNGQGVRFDRPFISPSGAQMRYPHDESLGAPADEIIACRCHMTLKVKYL